MAKKLLKVVKNILIFLFVILISILIIYYGCKLLGQEDKLMKILDKAKVEIELMISGKSAQQKNAECFVELKDENLNSEVEKARCYYYLQLNDTAKQFYMVFENNIDNFKNCKDNIRVPDSIANVLNKQNGQELVNQAFQDAWDAFIKDKPELFYFDGNKFCLVTKTTTRGNKASYELYIGKGKNENYFCNGFKTLEDIQEAEQKISEINQNINNNVATGNTYNKILQVHDYILQNTEYEQSLKKANNGNIYGSLVNKTAICEGYAKTFKYIMDQQNIPCIIITGIAIDESGKEEKHAWNYVYLNAVWYAIDTTWDDPIIVGNGKKTDKMKYKYFLKGSNTINQDHTITGIVTENGKIFTYPELSNSDY